VAAGSHQEPYDIGKPTADAVSLNVFAEFWSGASVPRGADAWHFLVIAVVLPVLGLTL
jgi:hypothetical protein